MQVKKYVDGRKEIEQGIGDWGIQNNQRIANVNKKELMKKTEDAYTFIKNLNASSGTVALLIITAGFQAVNCAINLLHDKITYPQAAAVMARLMLWGFLLAFPFHKAAGINVVY